MLIFISYTYIDDEYDPPASQPKAKKTRIATPRGSTSRVTPSKDARKNPTSQEKPLEDVQEEGKQSEVPTHTNPYVIHNEPLDITEMDPDLVVSSFNIIPAPRDSYCMFHAALGPGWEKHRIFLTRRLQNLTPSGWGRTQLGAFERGEPLDPYPDFRGLCAISYFTQRAVVVYTLLDEEHRIIQAVEYTAIGDTYTEATVHHIDPLPVVVSRFHQERPIALLHHMTKDPKESHYERLIPK